VFFSVERSLVRPSKLGVLNAETSWQRRRPTHNARLLALPHMVLSYPIFFSQWVKRTQKSCVTKCLYTPETFFLLWHEQAPFLGDQRFGGLSLRRCCTFFYFTFLYVFVSEEF
jgi:hypothetical protein